MYDDIIHSQCIFNLSFQLIHAIPIESTKTKIALMIICLDKSNLNEVPFVKLWAASIRKIYLNNPPGQCLLEVLHMKKLNQIESPIFVILCVLCFQRQSLLTFNARKNELECANKIIRRGRRTHGVPFLFMHCLNLLMFFFVVLFFFFFFVNFGIKHKHKG